MGHNWDKFSLLMWKNYKLQIRKPIQTLFEICVPIFFAGLLLLMRSVIHPQAENEKIYYPFSAMDSKPSPVTPAPPPLTTTVSPLTTTASPDHGNITTIDFGYYPGCEGTNLADLNDVMEKFKKLSNISDVKKFDTKTSFEKWYLIQGTKFTIALEFCGSPKNLDVTIRMYSGGDSWMTNRLYPVYQVPGPRSPSVNEGGPPNYFKNLFLLVQEIVTASAVWKENGDPSSLHLFKNLQIQRFPYGKYLDDQLLPAMQTSMGMIFLLAFMFTCTCTVKAITTEKQKQLKETMKIMGLSGWLHWTAWFVKSFIFLFITVFIIGIMMKIDIHGQSIIVYSNYFIFVLFLILYMCATITFCFAVSVFFSKANIAATIAGLSWFILYTPYSFLQSKYDVLSLSSKLASCLGFNSAMAYGFQLFIMFEGTMEGIQWNNFHRPLDDDDNMSLLHVMMMLIVDSIIHIVITLYFEAIFPGEFGIPKPWYFLFTRSYWFGDHQEYDHLNVTYVSEYFEEEPSLHADVQIQNMRKCFGTNEAVKGLNLNMYRDQITVLLGHNGAGKTTTMSMLTGMFPPTTGTALVNGCDINTNIDGVRRSLGLCPQHNVIFDDLTVREHLYFSCKLKGLRGRQVEDEIQKYINLLELNPKENAKASTLSGGMKRKLCVGMALCGDSQVVMLDEPTAGMDPSARRALWNLIQNQKKGRTILLTTHFMDEADLLGDRIAIMAEGTLQCCGSGFFLKKKYGAGYHLIVDKTASCNTETVTNLLKNYIPTIKVESDVGSELEYILSENQSRIFELMLRDLETKSAELGIRSYGISLTTLEEVFLKVGSDFENSNQSLNDYAEIDCQVDIGKPCLVTESALVWNQICAMFLKKTISVYRTWLQHVIQFLVPVVFIVLAVTIVKNNNKEEESPGLKFSLDAYDSPVTLIEVPDTTKPFIANYIGLVPGSIVHTQDITKKMTFLTEKNPTTTRKQYIVGLSLDKDQQIVAWFNNDAYHSLPLSFGLALNALYKTIVGNDHSITFQNKPLPHTMEDSLKNLDGMNSSGFVIAYQLGFSMAFTSAFFILFYIRERVCKSKHLQFISGVKILVFWMVPFLIDVLLYIIITLLCIVTLLCFQETGFTTFDELGRIFAVLFSFCIAVLPLMYLCSHFFTIPTTGLTIMTLIGVFAGNAGLILIQVLSQPNLDLADLSDTLHWVFLFIPHYSMSSGMVDAYMKYMFNDVCNKKIDECIATHYMPNCAEFVCKNGSKSCCDLNDNYFAWDRPGIGSNITVSILSGVFFLIILIANEFSVFSCLYYLITQRSTKMPIIVADNEDADVKEEKSKIETTTETELINEYSLVLKDLTKYYGNLLAVNGLSLGVRKTECFGLLGINGAGKTSTFKMLTGDEIISYGNAWVNGYSIRNQMNTVKKFIGYCPQFDALLDDLTCRQTMKMFCLIRGIPLVDCNVVIEALANDLDFYKHLDKQVKQLSGGNKRKLSTAIALIGDPPVIYLDEPTTGMDPATKRHLWNTLSKLREEGKCIVLTSHSMEECEALCTRLAIMVNGNFKCLGSVQHLKNKFAEGYSLIIKVKKNDTHPGQIQNVDTQAIEDYVHQHFGKAQLREKHQELVTFYITDKSLPWSKMFGLLEKGKATLNIEDYSLAQSSLEQVFLTFTKYQVTSE